MQQTERLRRPWWYSRQFWGPALWLCLVAVTTAPATTEAAVAPSPAWPLVLTVDEAALLLRLDVGELEGLAGRQEIPARRIGSQWRFNRDALLAWLNGDWTLIATAVPPSAMGQISGTGTVAVEGEAGAPSGAEAREEPIGEAPEERTADEVFLRGRRVLLAPGEVTLDLGQFYAESENQLLVPVNGGVGLATVEKGTFTTFLAGRVGLFDETELFASATYRNQDSSVVLGSEQLSGSSKAEFGDVRLGLRRAVLQEGVGHPDVILTVHGRIPTRDGSYAVGGRVALVKSFDPVVLFGSVNYLHRFSRDFDDVTRLQPEDTIDVNLGYAYALNDTLTLSTAVSGLFTFDTAFDNTLLHAQQLFSLQFGLTARLAEGLYIEPTVSFGLNGPGDNFAFGVTLPYTFQL